MTSLDLAMAMGWLVLSSPTGGCGSKEKKEDSWDHFPKYPRLVFFTLSFLPSTPSAPPTPVSKTEEFRRGLGATALLQPQESSETKQTQHKGKERRDGIQPTSFPLVAWSSLSPILDFHGPIVCSL